MVLLAPWLFHLLLALQRETGLINALAASGRNFTVFVPEAGGAPVGGPQDGQLYLVAQGRYNAAALKAAATAGE